MSGGKKSHTGPKVKTKAKAKVAAKNKSRKGASKETKNKRLSRRQQNDANDEVDNIINTAIESKEEEEEKEEELLAEEDMEFVRDNVQNLSFLSSINPNKLTKVVKETKPKGKAVVSKKEKRGNGIPAPAELTESEDEDSDNEGESDLEVFSGSDDDDDELVDLVVSDSDVESMGDSDQGEARDDDDDEEEYEFRNSKARRASKRKTMLEGAMDYEHEGARSFGQVEKKRKVSNKLPIKTADGRLVIADGDSEPEEESEKDGGSEASSSDKEEDEEEEEEEELSEPETKHSEDYKTDHSIDPDREQMTRKQYIVAQQNRLAGLADTIMQSPDYGGKAYKILHHITEDTDPRVKRLGLLTQLAVFVDVLPDYRIRELSEKEKQTKVTKDVRQQRMQEEMLVRNYSAYLKQLFGACKKALKVFSDQSADIETGVVAARALGDLVNAHPHFNYRKDILAALVDVYVQPSSRINHEPFTPMAETARLAVLRLFRNDVSGEYSQNAVLLAAKRIKRLSYRVDGSALRPWLHLRLREELRQNPDDRKRAEEEQRRRERLREQRKLQKRKSGSAAVREAKRAAHESKRQAKTRKMQDEIDKNMKEAEAEVSREERERWYGETLKQVFITYFRILKQKDNIGGLLPAVLEGLAKYAHLISVEFFVDLFDLLKKIMRGQHGVGIGAEDANTEEGGDDLVSSKVSLRTSLLCVLTALHILTGQGEALNLDLKEFFYQLYALLPSLAASPQIEATRMSALSDGTRYSVYLTPAEIATANAARTAQLQAAKYGAVAGLESKQLDESVWEETVRSEADLLFDSLELMFLGRTKVSSIGRVAAFSKRLAQGALYWPSATAVRAIEFIHRLLLKYPALDRMFSTEEQTGSGVYLQYLDDPDMCNPFATCLFELHWLQIHHHSNVQAAITRLLAFAKEEEKKHSI